MSVLHKLVSNEAMSLPMRLLIRVVDVHWSISLVRRSFYYVRQTQAACLHVGQNCVPSHKTGPHFLPGCPERHHGPH